MKYNLLTFALTVFVLAIDRVAKMIAVYGLPDPGAHIGRFGNVFYGFVYSVHDGFLYNVHIPYLGILFSGVLACLLLSLAIKPLWGTVPQARLGAGLLVAGICSQVADFWQYGGGIDYVLLTVGYDGVVCNGADVMIVAGVSISMISALRQLSRGEQVGGSVTSRAA